MLKKISIVITCMAMLLLFVACSKDNTHQNDTGTNQTEISSISDTSKESKSIFRTENVVRITFYAYYGGGKGSDVPAEHLNEIISWLDSFEVDPDKTFPELVPPGTNTINVEIEYSDGSIIKQGMDTTEVDGVTYYIKGTTPPECYYEIKSKTRLK